MPLATNAIVATVAFVGTVLCATLYVLTAAGHFPSNDRLAHMRAGLGAAVLWGTMPLVAIAVLLGVLAAWWAVPVAYAVVGGSLAILVAPLLLQWFSDSFVDGPGGLATFAIMALVSAVIACAAVG